MNIKWIDIPRSNWGGEGTNLQKIIVLHWMVGEQPACDATFKNVNSKVSAHYSISSDGEVHQYVLDQNVAWHCGPNGNYKSIGIEHAGGQLINGVRKKPTQVCHDTSAQLVADLCRKHNINCDADHIKRHSDIMSTECPGSLDVEYIIQKANSIINGTPMQQFDFKLEKRGNDIWLIQNMAATGAYVAIDKITGQVTDKGNILDGLENSVSPNCTKRLYEITFNGISRTLDLRNAAPVEDTTEKQLAAALEKISSLEALGAVQDEKLTKLSTDLATANGIVAQREFEIETLNKSIKEKDETIVQLRKTSGVGILEEALNWILGIFNKK